MRLMSLSYVYLWQLFRPSLILPALLVSLLTLVWAPAAWAEQPSAPSSRCNNATLKGTYLYSLVGILDGKTYAEAGREVYDGKVGVELTYRGIGGATGTIRTTYRVSPDSSRFAYTITHGPGDRPTVLSGWEIRVDP
jgi:hypothetical protein